MAGTSYSIAHRDFCRFCGLHAYVQVSPLYKKPRQYVYRLYKMNQVELHPKTYSPFKYLSSNGDLQELILEAQSYILDASAILRRAQGCYLPEKSNFRHIERQTRLFYTIHRWMEVLIVCIWCKATYGFSLVNVFAWLDEYCRQCVYYARIVWAMHLLILARMARSGLCDRLHNWTNILTSNKLAYIAEAS